MFKQNLEKQQGVHVHSKPEYSILYDIMWDRQHKNQVTGVESWGKNRVEHLQQLFGTRFTFKETNAVLDLCCGLGRITAACLELNAGKVVAADGSFKGLSNAREKLTSLGHDSNRFDLVQVDVEKLDECFEDNSFDCVVHYYALQHIKDYRKTLSDIKKILTPNGVVAFNYFTVGTTHYMTKLLREIFLKYDSFLIFEFLEQIGYVKGSLRNFHHTDLLKLKDDFDKDKFPFVDELQQLAALHGSELVASKIHFEDFTTPYLHNFDHDEVVNYVTKELNLTVLNSSVGRIVAQKVEE